MTCPACAGGLPPDVPRCPDCGSPNPAFDPSGSTRAGWSDAAEVTRSGGPAPPQAGSGILGFVVLYAESADSTGRGPEPSLGRVYPLKKGDVFFLGKAPVPTEVPLPDGRKLLPTAWHLFPFTEDFAHISRRHLVVEMDRPGAATLIDLSTNGIYLQGEGKHLRRGKGEAARVTSVSGREKVVLGVDLSSSTDGALRDKAWRFQVQIVPVEAGVETTTGSKVRGRARR